MNLKAYVVKYYGLYALWLDEAVKQTYKNNNWGAFAANYLLYLITVTPAMAVKKVRK